MGEDFYRFRRRDLASDDTIGDFPRLKMAARDLLP
jgi:hypothetical protein